MPEEGTEPKVPVEPANQQQPVEPPAPTTEEQLKTLQTQLAERDRLLAQKEESYKGLQRTLNKTNEEVRKQADLKGEIDTVKEHIKILAAAYADRQPVDDVENVSPEKKVNLLKTFEELERKQGFKRQQEALITQAKEFQNRTEALGLTEKDESYVELQELVESGRFKTADMRLKKLEATKVTEKPKESEPKETEEQMKARIKQEVMKEMGLLKTDTAVPSGRTRGREDIIKGYAEGDSSVSESDYLKALGRG